MFPPRAVLLLLLASSTHQVKLLSPASLSNCILANMQSQGNHPLKYPMEHLGQTYEVVGLTKDCIFFTFFLSSIKNMNNYTEGPSFENKYANTEYCMGKKVFMMRTTGENRKMMFVVDTMGRRIRVQSVYEGQSRLVGDTLYILVDVLDRRLHAYSQPLEKTYTVEAIFNANYHVYVLARNHYGFRIFELMVELDSQLNLIPYLREESAEISNMLQPPFETPEVTVFHNLDLDRNIFNLHANDDINKACGIHHGVEKLLKNFPLLQHELVEKELCRLTEEVYKGDSVITNYIAEFINETEHNFYKTWSTKYKKKDNNNRSARNWSKERCEYYAGEERVEAWGLALWSRWRPDMGTLAIPFVSMLGATNRGISKRAGDAAKNVLYQEKNGRFYINRTTDCLGQLNYLMLYFYQMTANSEGKFDQTPNRYIFTTNRFFNEMNYHRRLARPHAIARVHKQNLRSGTLKLGLIFACVLAASGVFYAVLRFGLWSRKKYLKKGHRSHTSTANTD